MAVGKYKLIGFCATRMDQEPQNNYFNIIADSLENTDWRIMSFSSYNDLFNKNDYTKGCSQVFEVINYDILDIMMIYPKSIKDDAVTQKIIDNCHLHNVPVVLWDSKQEGCWSICFDEESSFAEIVRHVIEFHGAKLINVVAGIRGNEFSNRRIEIVKKVMGEYGLTLDENRIGYGDFYDYPTKVYMENFLSSGMTLPDAFICCNDSMAIQVCTSLEEHGINVPNDTIVTGFDGIEFEKFCTPRLTTATNKISSVRDILNRILIDIIKTPKECVEISAPCDVTFSESCGCKKINLRETNVNIIEYVKNFDDTNNYNKYLNEMSTEITERTGLLEMKEIIKRLMLENIWIILNEDFCVFDENVIKDNIKLDKNLLSLHDTVQVYINRGTGRSFFDYPNFDRKLIVPDLEGVFDRNISVAVVPLHFQNYIFGYLLKEHSDGELNYNFLMYFEEKLEQFLETMRKQQKLNAVNHQLEKLYLLDPMIDIFNRRGFYQEIDKIIDEKSYKYFTAVSIDMDGLKHINDNFGHNEGDCAIMALGSILTACAGKDMVCSRFGGDEFNVGIFSLENPLMRGTDFVKKVLKSIDEYNKSSHKKYQLEISVGISYDLCSHSMDIHEILGRADTLMYNDKLNRKKCRT